MGIEERQASMMHDTREMKAELMRNNGPSESSCSEGRAAVRVGPRGAEPTAAARLISSAGAAKLLEAEREDIQQKQERRLFVRMPRVVLE